DAPEPDAAVAAPPGHPHHLTDAVGEILEVAVTGGAAPRRKRRWVLPVRIAVSLAMLALLYLRFPDLDWDAAVPSWNRSTALWLIGATLLTLLGIVVSAVRWQQVL